MDTARQSIVVGAGPNGLAAAIVLAQSGRAVTVYEAADSIGGGARTAELTLPGFRHDVCGTVHALAPSSPFLLTLGLERFGLEWVHPDLPLAHPFDDGTAAVLHRSVEETAHQFEPMDADAYRRLIGPLAAHTDELWDAFLGPLSGAFRHPVLAARFGLRGLWPAPTLARARFRSRSARALLAGNAAHSIVDLREPATSSVALMLMLSGHADGWPFARSGSQALVDAMATLFRQLGGTIVTGQPVRSLRDLPRDATVVFDLTPRQILTIVGDELPPWYRRQLGRFRYGASAFKLDWALNGPIPWTAPDARRAGTVHLGGPMEQIIASEAALADGHETERPFVLLTQPSLFDPTRAPAGKHTAWAYCHVPAGSTIDMTARIEAQVERFAPGFRDLIIGRSVMSPGDFARYNENYVDGDINGGRQDLRQQFTRPVPRLDPYRTPNPRLFICSASTPPGGGIHGMAGFHGAQSALRRRR
jgi:phytoene dehydrogenase-like protein